RDGAREREQPARGGGAVRHLPQAVAERTERGDREGNPVLDQEVTDGLSARLADVRARIARAAGRAGRDPSTIRLVAISKTYPPDRIREAAAAGQTGFGENKVQEALPKMATSTDLPIRCHLVGHLQSNKATKAAERFHVIHSIDSPELLTRVDAAARAAGRPIDLLVQVELAREETQSGGEENDLPAIFAAAPRATHARPVGLMLLPP